MNYYKATVQYDGTNYCGFQWQKDIPTVQDDINQTLALLLKGKITTVGASRTDSGVHAVEQIVKITTDQQIECESFIFQLNKSLPQKIKCLSLVPCPGDFNPITGTQVKEYRYLFTNQISSMSTDEKYIANNPYKINIELMKKCAREIVGAHDFRNFCSTGSNVKTTIREITFCELSEVDPHSVLPKNDLFFLPHDLKQCYELRIIGNGFLKQMVRHLMSALWFVGSGKISPEEFSSLLRGEGKTKRLWKVATPRGLYLYRLTPKPTEI